MAKATSTKPKVSDIELLKPEEVQGSPMIGLPPIETILTPVETFAETGTLHYKEPQKPSSSKAADKTLSFEERIEAFIEDKKEWLKLNDFLKSLYPIPKSNEPPAYLNKGEMKRMRILLDNMQSHGKLQIKDNGHGKLGNHYYEGEQQFAKFYHIGNLTIEAKK